MNLVTSDARVKVTLHTVEEPDDDTTDSERSPPAVQVHTQGSTGPTAPTEAAAAKQGTPDVAQQQKGVAGVELKDDG